MLWVQCRTEDDAHRLLVFALAGSLNGGHLTPARISGVCPRSVDVLLPPEEVRDDKIQWIRRFPCVEQANWSYDPSPFPDSATLLQAELNSSRFALDPSINPDY